MFKTIPTLVMAALCLIFSSNTEAQAPSAKPQKPGNKAVDVTAKGIQVGQKVPADNPVLSKYKGKFLVLDFWATWCSPCLAMLPKMEALQSRFNDQVQFIKVTYQPEKEVLPFLAKLRNSQASMLPEVTADRQLHQLFPHVTLPHYVWIDQAGTVKAITGYKEVTAENIEKMLSSPASAKLQQKQDIRRTFDSSRPFFSSIDPFSIDPLLKYQVLTGYIDGTGAGYTVKNEASGTVRVTFRNFTIPMLYSRVFGRTEHFGKNRYAFEVANPEFLDPPADDKARAMWWKSNAYCYELVMPAVKDKNVLDLVKEDLDARFSNYEIRVEKRLRLCDVLLLTDSSKLKTKGGTPAVKFTGMGFWVRNQQLSGIIKHLNKMYLRSAYPLIDGTGFKEKADLEVSADLADIQELAKALEPFGLSIKREQRLINVLVFRDKKSTSNQPAHE